jgi:hypothetical protein
MDASRIKTLYPHVGAAVPVVAELIQHASKMKGLELKARLGVYVSDSTGKQVFKSGLGTNALYISQLLCRLETSAVWASRSNWTEQVDRYYLLPSGLEVRSSTEGLCDKDGSVHCVVSHVIKSNLGHVDLKWNVADPSSIMSAEGGMVVAVQVAAKQMEPIFEDELQDRVDNLHVVRIKQRKTFKYVSKGVSWSINVTQIYQAPTYAEALMLFRDGNVANYELEVKCENVLDHLRQNGWDFNRVATSLLMKISDMFEPSTGPTLASTINTLMPLLA